MDKKYKVEIYKEGRAVAGAWDYNTYTLKGARIATRRIINERHGTVFADIVNLKGELVERVVP